MQYGRSPNGRPEEDLTTFDRMGGLLLSRSSKKDSIECLQNFHIVKNYKSPVLQPELSYRCREIHQALITQVHPRYQNIQTATQS